MSEANYEPDANPGRWLKGYERYKSKDIKEKCKNPKLDAFWLAKKRIPCYSVPAFAEVAQLVEQWYRKP